MKVRVGSEMGGWVTVSAGVCVCSRMVDGVGSWPGLGMACFRADRHVQLEGDTVPSYNFS